MKQILFSFALVLLATVAGAQKLEDIRSKVESGKYTEAKPLVDQLVKEPGGASLSDAWLYRAVVYAALGTADPKTQLLADEAFHSITRYVQLEEAKDSSGRLMLSKLMGHRAFFDVYTLFFKLGANHFNSKNHTAAYTNFSTAAKMFDLLRRHGMTEVAFDTTTTLYAGVSAESANMPEEAVYYYSKIAEQKIRDTTHLGVFGYLINYHIGKGDLEKAAYYIDLAETVFPQRDAWMVYRLETAGEDTVARLKRYEELIAKYPGHKMLINDYAVEMYRYVYYSNQRSGDAAWLTKLRTAFRNAAVVNPTVTNQYIISTIYADDIAYLTQDIARLDKSAKQEDRERKMQLQAELEKTYRDLHIFALRAAAQYKTMGAGIKPADKGYYKRTLQYIIDYFRYFKQPSKVAEYEQQLAALQ